ncbi:hypothetical protein BSKO_10101 [Bryopsis sp. KO-2023]|nr:hypothetical protein BSKO_10101 [Bryopsis sp. KO-2023]
MDEPCTSISEGSLSQVFLDRPRGALIKQEITLQVIDSGWEVRTGFWGDYYVMRLHDRNRWALGFLCTSLFKTGIVKRLDDGAVVRLSEFVVTNYKWGKL